MRLTKVLTLGALLPAFIVCTPIETRQASVNGSIAGVTLTLGLAWRPPSGHAPLRREVNVLKQNFPDQWNIYILGLRALQLADHTLPTSYYQIAGIHGRPKKAWEGAVGLGSGDVGQYCPHNNQMFVTWHRPYLALYEQELYKQMRVIAGSYPPALAQRYSAAIEDFRIPYWDWGLGNTSLPDFFLNPTMNVTSTDGQPETIPNPFHHYEFPEGTEADFDDNTWWRGQNRTLRWPDTSSADAVTQNNKFVDSWNSYRQNFHNDAGKYLTSNGMAASNPYFSNGLENLHGGIHFTVGGAPGGTPPNQIDGHMWPPEYSAFDPVFWLHHCNVDRLFAMWQVLHPKSYLDPQPLTGTGNYWLSPFQNISGSTPLLPFWKTPNAFWTSDNVRDTVALGYAYPETQRWNFPSDDAFRLSLNATVARLYSPSVRAALTDIAALQDGLSGSVLSSENTYTDWTISIEASHTELTASFHIQISFLGVDPANGVQDVGFWAMALPSMNNDGPASASMKRQESLKADLGGTVGLTASLLDQVVAGNLKSLDASDVVPFLSAKLAWSVYMGGKSVANTELHTLTVKVSSSTVQIPDDPDLPVIRNNDVTTYPEITSSKLGTANV